MKKLDITSRERISTGFLKVDKVKIALPNNKEIVREVLQKKDVVAILAVTSNGEVYLTKQPRAGIEILDSIEIPAGLIEEGELPEASAKRELSEETGCTLTQPLIALGKFVGDPACCTSITNLFLALNVEKSGALNLDDDEYLETFTKNVSEVYSMLDKGEIMDANSVIALERARKYLKHF